MAPIPRIKLNSGFEIPVFGLGTWNSKPGEVRQAVIDAIDLGYRQIDCAYVYHNEKEVGEALTEVLTDGTVKREDLFITSKLWSTFHSPNLVEGALRESLDNLGLEYLDLFLIHWPNGYKEGGPLVPTNAKGGVEFSDVDYVDTWRAMEAMAKKGLVRSIGVSNFNKHQIERILASATILPAVNQIECHPYLNQSRLIEFCRSKGITIIGYSPLGSPQRPWGKPGEPNLMEDPKLIEISQRYNKSPAQVLLRYQLQRGVVIIPKSVTKSRIRQNMNIFDFVLTKEDMKLLNSFDCNERYCPNTVGLGHIHHPFQNDEF